MDRKTAQFSDCSTEPIHISGTIQDFGAVLAFKKDFTLTYLSANLGAYLSDLPKNLLDSSLAQILGTSAFDEVTVAISTRRYEEEPYFNLKTKGGSELRCKMHKVGDTFIMDLEPPQEIDHNLVLVKLPFAVSKIQSCSTKQKLLETSVEIIRDLTGYEKVMIYKFHPDLHGEVVAESAEESVDKFLGLHYPAGDIPSQSRNLFLLNRARIISDAAYKPVPLLPTRNAEAALDLSRSNLRSVAPIHVEYMNNMKVQASLTLSLIVNGELWGLIACHHYSSPKLQCIELRAACEMFSRVVSSEITLHNLREVDFQRERSKELRSFLRQEMQNEDNLAKGLFGKTRDVLHLLPPDCTGAATLYDGEWFLSGITPRVPELDLLIKWINSNHPEEDYFFSDSLPSIYPAAMQYKDKCCGILAVTIHKGTNNFLMWFKPEYIRDENWAGNPEKKTEGVDGKLHPRKSFELWAKTVQDKSRPWKIWEQEEAMKLRNQILDIDLKRQFEKEQISRKVAEDAISIIKIKTRELDEQRENSLRSAKMASLGAMAGSIAHEINNPLAIISTSSLVLAKQIEAKADEAVIKHTIGDIKETVERIGKIVRSLSFFVRDSTTEAKVQIPVAQLLDTTLPLAEDKIRSQGCKLSIQGDRELLVRCRPVAISQILLNLLNNSLDAIKDQPNKWIKVIFKEKDGFFLLKLIDSGPGVPAELADKLMDPFFTTKPAGQGTGLGLAISKGLAEQDKGELYLDRESPNTCFVLKLPLT
ncbi:MAG TPA: ATP-binding protein [Bacteriovoracaceae bacterium]|nr:ATP-binding protein [Bacteriovoracaceae bacterium]